MTQAELGSAALKAGGSLRMRTLGRLALSAAKSHVGSVVAGARHGWDVG